jgi:hypothetical protein
VSHEEVKMNLYYLANGLVLATEDANVDKHGYAFDTKKTLIVGIQLQGSHANVSLAKSSESVGKPSGISVSREAVIMVTDIRDANLVQQMKAALAGLVVVPGNNRMN